MKFDVKKAKELLFDTEFLVQDHDNQFQFYGILKPSTSKPDELAFYIVCPVGGSKIRGIYTFPAGSKFTMRKMEFDLYKKEWEYTSTVISWKDITETDDDDDSVKEEKNMIEEEKNTTGSFPCVVSSDDAWSINEDINKGDHIYRIFNDKFDIKADMTIKSIGWSKINLHLMDLDVDISNIEVDEKLRVCQTSSENDPGILVMKRKFNFNKNLRSGCLYRIIDSSLNFKYLMYIRRFNEGHIDADIMKPTIHGDECSKIKTEHEQLSIIDLKDMLFNQIYFTEGCHLKNLE